MGRRESHSSGIKSHSRGLVPRVIGMGCRDPCNLPFAQVVACLGGFSRTHRLFGARADFNIRRTSTTRVLSAAGALTKGKIPFTAGLARDTCDRPCADTLASWFRGWICSFPLHSPSHLSDLSQAQRLAKVGWFLPSGQASPDDLPAGRHRKQSNPQLTIPATRKKSPRHSLRTLI